MAITKKKKEEILNNLKEIIKDAESLVFVNFHGLNVSEITDLRRELKKTKTNYLVAKKTLVRKAFDEAGVEGEMPSLEGELGLSYGEDSLDPARETYSQAKKYEGKLSILGGVFEGKFLNKEEMVSVAQIPSQEVLRAQFVNVINSPIRGLVVSLDQISKLKA